MSSRTLSLGRYPAWAGTTQHKHVGLVEWHMPPPMLRASAALRRKPLRWRYRPGDRRARPQPWRAASAGWPWPLPSPSSRPSARPTCAGHILRHTISSLEALQPRLANSPGGGSAPGPLSLGVQRRGRETGLEVRRGVARKSRWRTVARSGPGANKLRYNPCGGWAAHVLRGATWETRAQGWWSAELLGSYGVACEARQYKHKPMSPRICAGIKVCAGKGGDKRQPASDRDNGAELCSTRGSTVERDCTPRPMRHRGSGRSRQLSLWHKIRQGGSKRCGCLIGEMWRAVSCGPRKGTGAGFALADTGLIRLGSGRASVPRAPFAAQTRLRGVKSYRWHRCLSTSDFCEAERGTRFAPTPPSGLLARFPGRFRGCHRWAL